MSLAKATSVFQQVIYAEIQLKVLATLGVEDGYSVNAVQASNQEAVHTLGHQKDLVLGSMVPKASQIYHIHVDNLYLLKVLRLANNLRKQCLLLILELNFGDQPISDLLKLIVWKLSICHQLEELADCFQELYSKWFYSVVIDSAEASGI